MTAPDNGRDVLAGLHQQCFDSHPRPWSAAEIGDLLGNPLNFLIDGPQGFLIGRTVADEAELLTLAVAPSARRQGIARDLLTRFDAAIRLRGATEAFLEVASDNDAARALYLGTGWAAAGLRRNYYAQGIDAVLMRKTV